MGSASFEFLPARYRLNLFRRVAAGGSPVDDIPGYLPSLAAVAGRRAPPVYRPVVKGLPAVAFCVQIEPI